MGLQLKRSWQGKFKGENTVDLCCKTQKGDIEDFRFAFNVMGRKIIRNREIENP